MKNYSCPNCKKTDHVIEVLGEAPAIFSFNLETETVRYARTVFKKDSEIVRVYGDSRARCTNCKYEGEFLDFWTEKKQAELKSKIKIR